jgi:hypothetical protein
MKFALENLEWHPANTVPRDGTRVLTCYGATIAIRHDGTEVVLNDDSHEIYEWMDGGWYDGEMIAREGSDGPPFEFWMLLPPVPPSSAEG